jgi:hypothetical protein
MRQDFTAWLDSTAMEEVFKNRVEFMKACNIARQQCVELNLEVNGVAKAADIWAVAFWYNVWPLDLVVRHKCIQRKWQF